MEINYSRTERRAVAENLPGLILAIDSRGNGCVSSTTKSNCLFSVPFPWWEELDTLLAGTSRCLKLEVAEIILESGTHDETINQNNIEARLCVAYNWRVRFRCESPSICIYMDIALTVAKKAEFNTKNILHFSGVP
jgi:hypothetical protein